jgi:signal transduction histidine kinase
VPQPPDALIRSSRGWDTVLAGVLDGVTVQDRTGRLIYANPAGLALIGFATLDALLAATPAEVMQAFRLFDEAGRPMPLDALPGRRALLNEPSQPTTVRYVVHPSGEERFASVRAEPIPDEDGRVAFVVNTFSDITEAKQTERWLRLLADAGELLSESLDYEKTLQRVASLAVPVLADWCAVDLLDDRGLLRRVAIHHADPEKLTLAETLRQRRPPDPEQDAGAYRVARTGEAELVQLTDEQIEQLAVAQGWESDFLAMVHLLGLRSAMSVPMTGSDGVIGVLTLVSAESARRYRERDLAVAELLARRAALAVENSRLYREAERAIAARDQFLALAAHELLTPITIVRGYCDALCRTVGQAFERAGGATEVSIDGARLDRSARKLDEATDRLTRLIHDLLDVSRLQQGTLAPSPQPMDLSQLVASALESIEVQRAGGRYPQDVALRAELPVGGAVVGSWDPVRVEQVLFNVIDNAMKYSSPGGEVSLRLAVEGEDARLTVRDGGMGIDADELEAIFEPFHRAPAAGDRAFGFGMGLAVCREIVERHGGTIRAESDGAGLGTTLTITLPGARLEAVVGGSQPAPEPAPRPRLSPETA